MGNLLNLERVSKAYGIRPLLTDVSLGISAGERIGIVGRNGDGKTTLLEVMTGQQEPDTGRVSLTRGLHIGFLHQGDMLDDTHTVREAVLGGRSDHEWAADSSTREVVEELLAGVALDRAVVGLSGGERRRCSLAALLLGDHDLIVLDEPTNHLDVEAVAWLAGHLVARTSALFVVTHDRWFLDAVCQQTWEVHDGVVDAYDGGYAAFVLAATTGMRRGEVTALRWQDLDLDGGLLRVEQSVIAVRGELVFSAPKTKKGSRQISLDPATIAVLRAHRARQSERRLAQGPAWVETGRVFTREDGSLVHPDVLSKRFDAWLRRIGLPHISFHGLRHTWATMALEKGIHTKVVSERLGHANIAVTLDIYSKVRPALDLEAAERVARELFAT